MLTANQVSGAKVLARDVRRDDGPFVCPACSSRVVIHKGPLKVHHFAHAARAECAYGAGESEAHRLCKESLYLQLRDHPAVTKLELERDLGESRPDISGRVHGTPVAIEAQISSLGLDEVSRRTEAYSRRGIYTLWLGLDHFGLDDDKYSPRAWEKWLHAAYFGRAYFWRPGVGLTAVHFGDYMLEVECREWYEDGELQEAGGYSRRSKRYRTPVRGPTVSIADDFVPRERGAWGGGGLSVPPSRLWIDRAEKWW